MRREAMAACGVRLSLVYVTALPSRSPGMVEVRLAWQTGKGE